MNVNYMTNSRGHINVVVATPSNTNNNSVSDGNCCSDEYMGNNGSNGCFGMFQQQNNNNGSINYTSNNPFCGCGGDTSNSSPYTISRAQPSEFLFIPQQQQPQPQQQLLLQSAHLQNAPQLPTTLNQTRSRTTNSTTTPMSTWSSFPLFGGVGGSDGRGNPRFDWGRNDHIDNDSLLSHRQQQELTGLLDGNSSGKKSKSSSSSQPPAQPLSVYSHFGSFFQQPQENINSGTANSDTSHSLLPLPGNSNDDDCDDDIDRVNKDLIKLSVKERNTILNDIHGVDDVIEETSEFILKSFDKLKFHIEMLREQHTAGTPGSSGGSDDGDDSSNDESHYPNMMEVEKEDDNSSNNAIIRSGIEAYNKACFLSPSLYNLESYHSLTEASRNFYFMFLRSSEYDPQQTSIKIMKHFYFKKQLFGLDKVAKDITIEDLDDDDIDALSSGYHIFLPGKDNAGRAVCLITANYANYKTWMSQLRVNWCNLMTTIQNDVNVQKRGIVFVLYEVGRSLTQVRNQWKKRMGGVPLWRDGIPMKLVCTHFCYNDYMINAFIKILQKFSGQKLRIRFRGHYGGHIECQYELMSFGIPTSLLGVDHEGFLREGVVEEHIERLRAICKAKKLKYGEKGVNGTTKHIVMATDKDVLLGRGKPYQTHPGNLQLAKILQEREEEFNAATKSQKTAITWEILRQIQKGFGGRFLERDENEASDGGITWKVCSSEAARNKVAYGFRSRVKMQKRNIASSAKAGPGGEQEKRRKYA